MAFSLCFWLRTVGRHVAVHINQAESDKRLAECRQFGAYNRLTAFLMHDLNNLIAQQSLVVKNVEKFRNNPRFVDDTFDTITHSVARMNRLMEQLTSASKAPTVRRMDLRDALKRAVDRRQSRAFILAIRQHKGQSKHGNRCVSGQGLCAYAPWSDVRWRCRPNWVLVPNF